MSEVQEPRDELPRQRLFDLLPRRSLVRITVLLAMLAGVVILQRRAGAMAGCMGDAMIPSRGESAPRVRGGAPPTPRTP